MAVYGFGTLPEQQLPSLWDLDQMREISLASGQTFDQVLQDIQDGLNMLNAWFTTMPVYSQLYAVQDNVEVEYIAGGRKGIKEITEFSKPDPVKGRVTGHSINVKDWGGSVGWTWLALPQLSLGTIDATIQILMNDARYQFRQRMLRKSFLMEAEDVGSITGGSVPFADGGTADASYIPPPSPKGEDFLNTHNHYLRLATLDMTAVNTAVAHLTEHGHQHPFHLIAADADKATWTALSGWRKPDWSGLLIYQDTSSGTDRANLKDTTEYDGYIETDEGVCFVSFNSLVPTNYFHVTKSYGPGDPRNGLRLRFNPVFGFGYRIVQGMWVNLPEQLAMIHNAYDFGVGQDRTNGVSVYIAGAGNYVSPTI